MGFKRTPCIRDKQLINGTWYFIKLGQFWELWRCGSQPSRVGQWQTACASPEFIQGQKMMEADGSWWKWHTTLSLVHQWKSLSGLVHYYSTHVPGKHQSQSMYTIVYLCLQIPQHTSSSLFMTKLGCKLGQFSASHILPNGRHGWRIVTGPGGRPGGTASRRVLKSRDKSTSEKTTMWKINIKIKLFTTVLHSITTYTTVLDSISNVTVSCSCLQMLNGCLERANRCVSSKIRWA